MKYVKINKKKYISQKKLLSKKKNDGATKNKYTEFINNEVKKFLFPLTFLFLRNL